MNPERLTDGLRSLCHWSLLALLACGGAEASTVPPGTAAGAEGATSSSPVDLKLRDAMARGHIAGLSAVLVKDGEIVWSGAYGLADVAAERPVTPDTLFMMASVSKAIAATCAMAAVEDEAVDLDADINTYLPFEVTHPSSDTPITLRHLLTHTSGIRDDNDYIWGQYVYGSDATKPLAEYLEAYLAPTGADFDASHFASVPGETHTYSNIGATLAGYVIEAATETDFAEYCERKIFEPLGLEDTHWFLRDADPQRVALPYEWNGSEFTTRGHYGYPDYPDGQLRATARDMAEVLIMVAAEGIHGSTRVLSEASVREMVRPHLNVGNTAQALGWYHLADGVDRYLGHSGGDIGASTDIFIRESDGLGVVLLTNSRHGGSQPSTFNEIELLLMEHGASL